MRAGTLLQQELERTERAAAETSSTLQKKLQLLEFQYGEVKVQLEEAQEAKEFYMYEKKKATQATQRAVSSKAEQRKSGIYFRLTLYFCTA